MVSGPSGAGKTTVVAGALERRPDVMLSVSATTRPPRAGEVDGQDYHFLSPERFAAMEDRGEFLEVAEVHGNRYGTPRGPVDQALAAGRTVLLEIDVQGAASVRAAMPEAVLVFVRPPDEQVLRARLEGRGTDDEAVIQRRLRNARDELAAGESFDHQVVNDDLEEAISQLIRILDGSRTPNRADRTTPRGPGHPGGSA